MQQVHLDANVTFAPDLLSNSFRAARAAATLERLTHRQRQVLEGMIRGMLNKEIALWLGLDEKTIKMHRAALIARIRVRSSADAIRIGVEASFHVLGRPPEGGISGNYTGEAHRDCCDVREGRQITLASR